MSEPIKLSDEEIKEWLNHPTTDAQLKNLSRRIDQALSKLLSAARNCPEPTVRSASAEYETYKKMLRIFQETHGPTETE